MSEKNFFPRSLTKAVGAILRPFLESSPCLKKTFSRSLTKALGAILRPFLESTCSPCQKKNLHEFFFGQKQRKILTKKIRKILVVKNKEKKNVKKPYFSGDKKNCQKTLFFRREKKCQKPLLKKNSKNFYSQIHCKKNSKNFGHFLVVKIMSFSLEKV